MPAFTITSGSTVINIDTLTSANQPREEVNTSTFDYSLNGTVLRRIPVFRRFVWNITALVTWDQFDNLIDIWSLQEGGAIDYFTLDDYTAPLVKEVARTRLLAQGTTETVEGGLTKYNGQFYACFSQEPKREGTGGFGTVNKIEVPIQMFEYQLSL